MTTALSPTELLARLQAMRPGSRTQLQAWVQTFLGLRIPTQRCCPGHVSPMDYLSWSVLSSEFCVQGTERAASNNAEHITHNPEFADAIVWACRGGGKTLLGAVASLLELLFLPQCQVRILGGSEVQSARMYEYLTGWIGGEFAHRLDGRLTSRGCRFDNNAGVQILAQSDKAVRGQHVQRLRCDEVELFEPEIWQAAQFTTHSLSHIRAKLEVFSTMHRPHGLMQQLVSTAPQTGMRLFTWCLWEVIEKCVDRECSQCPLWEDCRGRAKQADGYYKINDAIAQMRRSSRRAWEAEMLCQRPSAQGLVFPEFDPAVHVRPLTYNSQLPLYRAIDFGFTHPLACLFIQTDAHGNVFVIDEHIKSHTTLQRHAELIRQAYPQRVEETYVDPAGRQRREITGTSVITELAALGISCKFRRSRITDGLELIRCHLAPALGGSLGGVMESPRLFIGSRCEQLIRALSCLRYQTLNGRIQETTDNTHVSGGVPYSELPEKDGVHDHPVDALRYFFVNHYGRPQQTREARY